jgi:hypothetical protein
VGAVREERDVIALGVDLEQSTVRIAVREGGGSGHCVSDGRGTLIPLPGARGAPAEALEVFWARLIARTSGHLGVRAQELPAPVIAAEEAQVSAHLAAMAQAGWRRPQLIAPAQALLTAALAMPGEGVERWVVLVLGERRTAVQGFMTDRKTRSRRPLSEHVIEAGHEVLARRVCALAGIAPARIDRVCADAVLDFATELSSAGDRAVPWRGPTGDGAATPLVRRRDCAAWPEVAALETSLRRAIGAAMEGMGSACRFAIGGIGAVWPFAGTLVTGELQRSALIDPLFVAVGASLTEEARRESVIEYAASPARDGAAGTDPVLGARPMRRAEPARGGDGSRADGGRAGDGEAPQPPWMRGRPPREEPR